jgi:hypothetical protein
MKTMPNQKSTRRMIQRWFPNFPDDRVVEIRTDTTDFFRVNYDDVLILGERAYFIRHNAKEGRFGLDDEEKFWVKRAFDLQDGSRKIIKLVFHERFKTVIGDIEFECFRSPRKEARILELAGDHKNFMNGYAITDQKGNLVRVLNFIYGKPLSIMVQDIQLDHETYFLRMFPDILGHFIECIRAIRFLHEHEENHGDIRRDHIIVDRKSGHYRWIDFDFNYRQRENIFSYDLFGLGNILIFLVGKGDVLLSNLSRERHPAYHRIEADDLNIVFRRRVANLRKIYPYIPESLNRILLHFSEGANWFYESTNQFLEDLEGYCKSVGGNGISFEGLYNETEGETLEDMFEGKDNR